jgi:hypothetical protein
MIDTVLSLLKEDGITTSFPVAINKLINGRPIARTGIKNTWFKAQEITDKSKMTMPYVYKVNTEGIYIPYSFTNEDIFATDWVIL